MNNSVQTPLVKSQSRPLGLSVSPYLNARDTFGELDRPIQIQQFRNDVVLKDPLVRMHPTPLENRRKRGKVIKLTSKAQKRMAFVANNTDVPLNGMLTLTYHVDVAPTDGRIAKKHLNAWLSYWRRSGRGEYLWFLEFTKKEAVHFHMFTEASPAYPRVTVSKGAQLNIEETRDMSLRWSQIVAPGGEIQQKMSRSSARFELVREPDGAGRYASKYAFKREQKEVPLKYSDVGRFWGASRGLKPLPRQETTITAREAYERFKAFYVEERDFHFFYGIQHGSCRPES